MAKEKKALLLGGSGALGTYLAPALVKMGYKVDIVCLEDIVSQDPNLNYIKANAKELDFVNEIIKNEYSAIVDFMLYFSEEEFANYYKLYLENCDHYVFLSSYRIYADSATPITEESDRLLEVAKDPVFLGSGDYALYKAQQEDMLHKSGYKNYTILRPSITYSKNRFQLVTLEANTVVYRMLRGKILVLPEYAMGIMGTLSWAGDFGTMVSRLVNNPDAFGEVYTIGTSEHYTWGEIAEIYKDLGGLKYVTTDTESYLKIINPEVPLYSRQQLTYDRYFNRAIDNSKILNATGLKQSDLMPLREGLKMELAGVPKDASWEDYGINARMDEFLKTV